jgi:S-adenosylmethionine-diacylglycerol 3-amino-3-carboxypropyl transferase
VRRRQSRGLLGSGLFGLLWRHCLVYNQCWEDPAVDRKALVLTPEDRVMVITSAGCNALDYALLGARIVAVDANPRQNHLLELKRAGIRALDFDDFFALFGQGGSGRAREIYAGLRHALPDDARAFWDREVRLFEPGAGRSFYYRGTAGLVALLLNWHIDRVSRTRRIVDRILDARDLPEQIGIYRAELRDRLLGKPLLKLLGSPGVLSLLGVPDPQRRMIHGGSGGFAGFLRRAIDHVMSVALLRDNYFWSVYVNGGYRPGSCPEYLRRESFEKLKGGLVENVSSRTGTVTECLARDGGSFTAFVLLDHMDWMARASRLLEEEWEQIFDAAAPGARVIFRSGGKDAAFLPLAVLRRLAFDRARAEALHRQDRVGTYGSFHIARLALA